MCVCIKSSYRATRFDHKMILFTSFYYTSIIITASSFLFGYTEISTLGCSSIHVNTKHLKAIKIYEK